MAFISHITDVAQVGIVKNCVQDSLEESRSFINQMFYTAEAVWSLKIRNRYRVGY
jgi:hypothetical protein